MSKEPVVDYLDAVARFASEDRDARVDPAVMPEPAGEQVVDYLAVSEKWKEEKVRLMRVQSREE
ncbi:MAG: hypothetical protein IKG23_09610 [Clostridia bacterium]|nr:hypothetical protein [Clostridia bacterium]